MKSYFPFSIYRLGIISLAHAPVHVTDFPVVNVHVVELSSARIWQHKLCATFSASVIFLPSSNQSILHCNSVECGIKHHQPNLLFTKTYTYLPIYLHFYENYRFYSIFASYFPILMSFKFPQSNLFYITA